MNIIDRIKLIFTPVGSPTEKRPDDITSKAEAGASCSMKSKCCSAPAVEAKGCCADGECECK